MNVIGVNIRNIRMNRGMTQEELAEKLGVSNQAISAYESGIRTPKMKFIIHMAEYFHLTLADIIETKPSDVELRLLSSFRSLTDVNKSEILDFIEIKLRKQEESRKQRAHYEEN